MSAHWEWIAARSPSLDENGLLVLYAGLAILLSMVAWLLRDIARTTDRRPDLRQLDEVELAYLFGGAGRAADTLYLALARHGAAARDGGDIVVADQRNGLPPVLETFRVALVGRHSRRRFASDVRGTSPFGAMLDGLTRRKILLGAARRRALKRATWCPGGLLLAFGTSGVMLAVARGELGVALIVAVLATLAGIRAWLARERYLTREALASLTPLRDSRSHLLQVPSPENVAVAFAMNGAVALEGAGRASSITPAEDSRDDGGDSGS